MPRSDNVQCLFSWYPYAFVSLAPKVIYPTDRFT